MTSSISATNGAYTATAGRVCEGTQKSVETFKQGVERFTAQANVVARMPEIDLTVPVAKYFEYVQQLVDLNRDLATRWAEIVTSLYGTVREQADKVNGAVKDQASALADHTVRQAQRAEDVAKEQATAAEEAKEGRRTTGTGC